MWPFTVRPFIKDIKKIVKDRSRWEVLNNIITVYTKDKESKLCSFFQTFDSITLYVFGFGPPEIIGLSAWEMGVMRTLYAKCIDKSNKEFNKKVSALIRENV